MKKTIAIVTLVFGLLGAGLLLGSLYALKRSYDFRRESVQVDGKVVGMERSRSSKGRSSYKPVVEYVDSRGNAHQVVGSISNNPPRYDLGDQATVRYLSEHPDQARIDDFSENYFAACLLGGLGTIFGGISAGFVVSRVRKKRLREWLELNGTRVQARVAGATMNANLQVYGRHPWRISAQWQHPLTRQVHQFHSDNLWTDPTPYLKSETISVRVDADRPSRYFMDVSFLPGED